MIPRTHHAIKALDRDDLDEYMTDTPEERQQPVPIHDANTIASRIACAGNGPDLGDEELHAPVLDIDFPVFVVPSSTPGHYHLFLERPMRWRDYEVLLDAFARAGVLEVGYVRASIERRSTYVRRHDVLKPDARAAQDERLAELVRKAEVALLAPAPGEEPF